ncbi:hypothetical protein GCM10009133_13550 [Cocleimonas flava]|uniref:AlwI restriction endonuclease n=1 Tax=Cocleimonas flava TaxID=634765 RepID=A0A4R1F4X8_9GAMM|nr:AlwI family type II restriction endonuclease [Cocleimonas flava]TCJ87722.1 AlwI restriction endonuclease [Cocleimonas flava]
MLWHIANTTVRTPYRLHDALLALENSPLNGNLSGKEQENAFAALLHNEGVLDAPRVQAGEDASDLGRKWRVALSQLGFITPQLTRGTENGMIDPALLPSIQHIEELSGRSYEITPNGYRLAKAEIITAQQECFLRSLAIYTIPSIMEGNYKCEAFSPLHFVLCIMRDLANNGQREILTFQEFALFVQTSTPADGLDLIVQSIIQFREGREQAKGKVRAYDRVIYNKVAARIDRKAATLNDYTDLSFRYLKSTGIFRNAGRGIALSPSRAALAELLREEEHPKLSSEDYLSTLWRGSKLPTDNAAASYSVITDLAGRLRKRGILVDIPSTTTPLPDLENIRHTFEVYVLQLEEQEYANDQSEQLDEIIAWLEAIPKRGSAKLPNGETVSVPQGEAPAYLEWAVWRAFLAINSLSNTPWEARRFQIDQDFLPVHHAPGGGADMIFEFEEVIIVAEVTLTSSSRQEAAEGEPVRRHVAQFLESTNKPVYGLFIAVQIDSNTAHTFRSGDWYLPDDTKLSLDIIPLTLSDFKDLLVSGRDRMSEMPNILRQILIECRAKANQDAPQWKDSISSIVQHASNNKML